MKVDQTEVRILSNWEINSVPLYIGPPRSPRNQLQSSDQWSRPPQWIYKLNFDGVAKGNPELTRIGREIRNFEGNILGVF